MRAMSRVVTTTALGGLLFLLPVVVVLWLATQAFGLAQRVLAPAAHLVPAGNIAGIAAANVAAVALLVALCFIAGLAARTAMGQNFNRRLEHAILGRIPGFTLAKSAAQGLMGLQGGGDVQSAFAMVEDAWVPAFVMEQHANGDLTVFVPSVPTPAAGTVYILEPARVRLLPDVSVTAMVSVVMRLGVGLRAVAERSAPA